MKKVNHLSLDQVKEAVTGLVTTMKSVKGFKVGEPIVGFVKKMASAIEDGNIESAIEAGLEAVSIGRGILGAFLRNSVIDRTPEGLPETPAFFTRELSRLRDVEGYDEDLMARLEKLRKELDAAVRAETNGTFTSRVMAYNAMSVGLDEAEDEQVKRDRVRRVRAEADAKARKNQKDADATARNQAHAATQREQVLAARRADADSLRSLVG